MLLINQSCCLECGGCVAICPEEALFLSFDSLECVFDSCTLCGLCELFCPVGAIKEKDAI